MKYLKTFEIFEKNENETTDEVVKRYCEQYPGYSDFFKKFIEKFSNKEDFIEKEWDYLDDEGEDDDEGYVDEDEDEGYMKESEEESEEDRFDRLWSPESEVYMLQQEIGNYPGDEIWPDFYNDISDAWHFMKTPLAQDSQKYNI